MIQTTLKSRDFLGAFLFSFLFSFAVFAQDLNGLNPERLHTVEDYREAEPRVLDCANFLFVTPIDQEELSRKATFKYLYKWMQGTPDYTFSVHEDATSLINDNDDMLTMYFAAMAKVVLENPETSLNDDELNDNATSYLIAYCLDPANHLPPTKKMKKRNKKDKEE